MTQNMKPPVVIMERKMTNAANADAEGLNEVRKCRGEAPAAENRGASGDDSRRLQMAILIGRLEARMSHAKGLIAIDATESAMNELNVALSEARHFWETGAVPPLE